MSKRNMNFPPTLTADDLDREREQILERMKSARAQQAAADARRQRMAMAEQQLQQAQTSDDRTVFTEGGFSQITDLKAASKITRNSGGRNSGSGPPPAASSGYGPGANAAGSVSIAGQSRHSGSGSGVGSRHSGSGFGSGNESTMLGPSTVVGQQSAVGSFLMKAPWGSGGGGGARRSSKTRGGNSSDTSIATGMTNSVVRQAANYVHSAQEGSKRFQPRQLSGRSGGSGLTEEEEEQQLRMKALAATAGSAVGSATDPQMAAKDRVERLSREVSSPQPLHSVDEGYEDEPSMAAPSKSGRSSNFNSSAQRQQPPRRDVMNSSMPAKSTRRMDASRAQSQPSQRNVADRRPQNLPPIGQSNQQQMAGQRPALSAARSAPSSRNTGGMSMAPSTYHAPSFGTSQQQHQAPPSPSGPLPMAISSAVGQDEMREYISPTQLQNRKILLGITVLVGVFACCGYGWLMVSRKMGVYSNVVPDTSVGMVVVVAPLLRPVGMVDPTFPRGRLVSRTFCVASSSLAMPLTTFGAPKVERSIGWYTKIPCSWNHHAARPRRTRLHKDLPSRFCSTPLVARHGRLPTTFYLAKTNANGTALMIEGTFQELDSATGMA